MFARIAAQNLVQSFLDIDMASVHIRGQVAVRQRLKQVLSWRRELHSETVDSALLGLDQRTGVMRDQPANHQIRPKDIPQVSSSIERMEAR